MAEATGIESPQLSPETKRILHEIQKQTKEELGKTLSIQGDLLEKTFGYYAHFGEKTLPALDLYEGMTFQQIDKKDKKLRRYFDRHLLILSALYGPIHALDPIAPYRLDMKSKLKIEGQTLSKYWKDPYQASIDPEEEILNLASDEFSSILEMTTHWMDVDFVKIVGGTEKTHSTTAKKGRGLLLNAMAKEQITQIKDIPQLHIPQMRFLKMGEESRMVFEIL